MPLFHSRVINKHIKNFENIPQHHIETLGKWADNLNRGIYDSETQNDGEFIQRILIDVLGYVGSSDGQKWTVAKNQPVGKGNVDAALGHFTADTVSIIAPLELKGAKTRDLDAVMAGRNKTPVQQAWEYAMDAKGAQWVLVSNYREIRLYAVGYGRKDYESFNLGNLTNKDQYARFILLLSAENLLSGKTLSLLKESEQAEEDITDKLYKDYKELRARLIKTLSEDNPEKDKLDIIRYTQTILDRILFVAFAEDKGLLPEKTLEKAYKSENLFNPQPVWENFKGLFHAINKGNPKLNITGYNGGLFADDKSLNSLNISDELCEGFKKIGEYNFDSDISVNILGHIFEQSISDLEELKAQAEGQEIVLDKKKGKRKKDGIFYTPPYITRYIVEQAVGGWLNDRRKEIGFDTLPVLTDEDYDSIKITGKRKLKHERNKNISVHIAAWEAYKTVLSNIKVLDPACGSGAFLNEVFDYLKNEGQTINNELARLTAGQIELFRWDTHILANNIYGVDLNSESVEITKLSLWLKTANKNEKLTYLENNIKVGNSLIDDEVIAGKLAFGWNKEFTDILGAGGFDVIVGNPPYVFAREKISEAEKDYYAKSYKSAQYQVNTYLLFIEKSIDLIKEKYGRCSLIVPNAWLMVSSAENLRNFLLKQTTLHSIVNLLGQSFESASVETIILNTQKSIAKESHEILILTNSENNAFIKTHTKKQSDFSSNSGSELKIFASKNDISVLEKISKKSLTLDDLYDVKAGLQAYEIGKGQPKQSPEDVKNRIYDFREKIDERTYKYLDGKDVGRYWHKWDGAYLQYGNHLAAPRDLKLFSSPSLIIREITGKHPKSLICTYTNGSEILLFNRSNIAILEKDKNYNLLFLLGILNSSLMSYYFMRTTPKSVRQLFPKIILKDLKTFPIKKSDSENQKSIISAVNQILVAYSKLNSISDGFLNLIKANFVISDISRVLTLWYTQDKPSFLIALEKQIKPTKLSLQQKSEWIQHFETEKAKAIALKNEIDRLDAEIDQMVYALYDLSPEEISIIESQT